MKKENKTKQNHPKLLYNNEDSCVPTNQNIILTSNYFKITNYFKKSCTFSQIPEFTYLWYIFISISYNLLIPDIKFNNWFDNRKFDSTN